MVLQWVRYIGCLVAVIRARRKTCTVEYLLAVTLAPLSQRYPKEGLLEGLYGIYDLQ